MNDDQDISGDVESGSIDSGLTENVVIHKIANVGHKAHVDEESDDPRSDVNCTGVGIMKIDD